MTRPDELWAGKGAGFRMRTEQEILLDIAQLLTEILAQLQRANSIERTGAVSSVSVETNSRGVVVGLKRYSGSEPEVTQALDDYGRLFTEANARALAGWERTVEQLAAERSAS